MKSLIFEKRGISSMALYMIVAFVLIAMVFGVFYKQTLTDHLINLIPGAGHTEKDPDLEANFVDEMISDLQFKVGFVEALKKYNFGNPQESLNILSKDCLRDGVGDVLSSQVPIMVLNSKNEILLSVKAPKGNFDLNPRTNPVQVKYTFRSDSSYVDFVWDGYFNKALAGVNKKDIYYDFSFYCNSDSDTKNGKFISSLFGTGFYSFYVSRFTKNPNFCNSLDLNLKSFNSFLSEFSKIIINKEINYNVYFVEGDAFFNELNALTISSNYKISSFQEFLSEKMLKGRPNYLEFWGKLNKDGYWEKNVGGMHCINKNPFDNPEYYCYPIYIYKQGTNEEKEYYFDYGVRKFKSVDGDVELDVLSEIGIGGKVVYFAGNQMWWAGCTSSILLQKGFVDMIAK
jgi:hypothetical protein